MIEPHGRSGSCARVSAVTWFAASPAISMARVSANSSISSASRSARWRPRAKRIAEFSASRRCCSRTRSRGFILHLGLAQYLIAKIAAQILGGAQIHPPSPEQNGELLLDVGEIQKAGPRLGQKFDEQIDIAARPRITFQHRSEPREAADLTPAAHRPQGGEVGKRKILYLHHISSPAASRRPDINNSCTSRLGNGTCGIRSATIARNSAIVPPAS